MLNSFVMDPNSLVLEAAFIGKSKEMLDPSAFGVDFGEVVLFLKYGVSTDKWSSTSPVLAFTIFMLHGKSCLVT